MKTFLRGLVLIGAIVVAVLLLVETPHLESSPEEERDEDISDQTSCLTTCQNGGYLEASVHNHVCTCSITYSIPMEDSSDEF